MKSLQEEKEQVLAVIDRSSWKHSWHLPKDRWGYTAWHEAETYRQCREFLRDAQGSAQTLLNETNRLLNEIDWAPCDEQNPGSESEADGAGGCTKTS